MVKRDPIKTARNRMIEEMKSELRSRLPQVLKETGLASEAALNAVIGGTAAHFIDLHHEVILSPDAYVALYMRGMMDAMSPRGHPQNSHRRNYEKLRASPAA